MAATSLLDGGCDLPAAARRALESALDSAARAGDHRARAWELRYGLDDAQRALRDRRASRSH